MDIKTTFIDKCHKSITGEHVSNKLYVSVAAPGVHVWLAYLLPPGP